MEKEVDLQCNKIAHLEYSMVMYGIYNSETCTYMEPKMLTEHAQLQMLSKHFRLHINTCFPVPFKT